MMSMIMCLMFSFSLIYFKKQIGYMICFFLSTLMLMILNFDKNLWVSVSGMFSFDFYSIYLVLLSFWVTGLMLMIIGKGKNFMILLLLMFLYLSFMTYDFLLFYFMFEASMLPIFFLIKLKGYSYERFEAILYMFMFTMISSMPFLLEVILINFKWKSLMYMYLETLNINLSGVSFLFMIMVFLVKMPVFMVHIWLPKAHVEAPVYGSMILAGVLLKLGSYGILRLMQMFNFNFSQKNYYYMMFSIVGGVVLSMICLLQIDLKMLVAYSSIVHMSLLISSMMTMSKVGILGAYLMMISHGLCSSGLFYLVNINYESLKSRLIFLNKGMVNIYPSMSMWWFFLCTANFSVPITLNLISEIFMLMSLVYWDYFLILFLVIFSFLSALYSLYLFSMTQHGEINNLNYFENIKMINYLILFLHWVPLNLLTLGLNLFMV